ncbi:MAG: hypothetical protein KAJ98_00610 [Spirochaetaceae bacterium]|nr:hypothetical protein [Spirochaetaceae bacterium]
MSFRTGDFDTNYLLRAAIAVHSLGNAVPEEVMFFHSFYDHEGQILNGEVSYEIRFENDHHFTVGILTTHRQRSFNFTHSGSATGTEPLEPSN